MQLEEFLQNDIVRYECIRDGFEIKTPLNIHYVPTALKLRRKFSFALPELPLLFAVLQLRCILGRDNLSTCSSVYGLSGRLQRRGFYIWHILGCVETSRSLGEAKQQPPDLAPFASGWRILNNSIQFVAGFLHSF